MARRNHRGKGSRIRREIANEARIRLGHAEKDKIFDLAKRAEVEKTSMDSFMEMQEKVAKIEKGKKR